MKMKKVPFGLKVFKTRYFGKVKFTLWIVQFWRVILNFVLCVEKDEEFTVANGWMLWNMLYFNIRKKGRQARRQFWVSTIFIIVCYTVYRHIFLIQATFRTCLIFWIELARNQIEIRLKKLRENECFAGNSRKNILCF